MFIDPNIDLGAVFVFLCYVFIFALIGTLLYALPISLIAELVLIKMKGIGFVILAFLIQLSAGLVCFTFLGFEFGKYGLICCILFFCVNFLLSKSVMFGDE